MRVFSQITASKNKNKTKKKTDKAKRGAPLLGLAKSIYYVVRYYFSNFFFMKKTFLFRSLGVGHDGGEICPDGRNIMATGASSGEGALKWSSCSGNAFQQFLS